MDAISKAIKDIKLVIDDVILMDAFMSNTQFVNYGSYTLDARITEDVIRAQVLPDINGHNGREMRIPLRGLTPEILEDDSCLFKIPRARTQGRGITSILALEYTDITRYANQDGYTNIPRVGISEAITNMTNALMGPLQMEENTARRVDDYTVWFRAMPYNFSECSLRVIVAYSENLSELSPRTWTAFSELCVLMAKAVCYHRLNKKYAHGRLSGGAEMSYVQDIISSYSDAHAMYTDMLKETWSVTALMDDPVQKANHLRSIVAPRSRG